MNKMTVMTCRSRLKGRPPSGTNLQTARHTPHSWKYWSSTGTSEVPPCTWKYHKVSQRQCVIRYTAGCIGHRQGHAMLSQVYAGQGHGQNRASPTEHNLCNVISNTADRWKDSGHSDLETFFHPEKVNNHTGLYVFGLIHDAICSNFIAHNC